MSDDLSVEDLKNIRVVDEPQFDIALKWLGFAITFVVMLMVLIYVSSYFARSNRTFIDDKYEKGVSAMDRYDDWKPPIEQQRSRNGSFNDEYDYNENEY
jgi:hypothetical protein